MLYDDKAPEILKQYNVRAFPTFVVTDAEGAELYRSVGAPFSSVSDATEWFPTVADDIKAAEVMEAKFVEDPENAELADDLIELHTANGQTAKAGAVFKAAKIDTLAEDDSARVEKMLELAAMYKDGYLASEALVVYKELSDGMSEDDDQYVDVQLAYADATLSSATKETRDEVYKEAMAIHNTVIPALIEAGDERAIDPTIVNARITVLVDEDAVSARTETLKLVEVFAESDRILMIKYWAAAFAQEAGETETARAEWEAIVEEGDAADRWVQASKKQIEKLGDAKPEDEDSKN